VIYNKPILNAKHNTFYKGSFNGNDCFQLIENHDLIFKTLKGYATDEIRVVDNSTEERNNKARDEANEIIDICERHESIWAKLAALLPAFRSVRKLSPFLKTSNCIGMPTSTIVVAVLPPSSAY
jgi:hypothetical protein